jgi:DNA polymerase (family 10)
MLNSEIAKMFEEIADMLELEDGDYRFEVRAYRKAALSLNTMQEDVGYIYKKGGAEALMEISGIGKGLAGKIIEYINTGKMAKHEQLKKKYPIDFENLTRIPGIGAKKAFKLYKYLKVKDVRDLKEVLAKHKIRDLEGFGEKSEEEISKGTALLESSKGRMPIGNALPEAESIIKELEASGLIKRSSIAGSARRMRDTVGDLDILVTSDQPGKVMKLIPKLSQIKSVALMGPTKTTVRLKAGISCDVRVVRDESFGAALQYFTGNKDHNIKVRQVAIKKGYKLNEYGLFDKKGRNLAGSEEKSVYDKLGMEIMDPEMRENRGEVELSIKHKIPRLVQLSDIKGDLHVHTNHSDGSNTILEMAEYARKLGLEYIGITDHTKSEYVAHGMDDAKFAKHLAEIDKLNSSIEGVTILKSAEIDILKDGSLDLSRKTMEALDYRLASVHTNLNMSMHDMTNRIIKAMESGYVDILAHPTDRIINARNPIQLDLDKMFDAADKNGVALEIDGYPDRLDLNDENIFKARNYNVQFAIDTDSHRDTHLELMRYGVSMAKRGWLQKKSIINSLGIKDLIKRFKINKTQ